MSRYFPILFFILLVSLTISPVYGEKVCLTFQIENQFIQPTKNFDAGRPEPLSPGEINVINYIPQENKIQNETFSKILKVFPTISELNFNLHYYTKLFITSKSNIPINLLICIILV